MKNSEKLFAVPLIALLSMAWPTVAVSQEREKLPPKPYKSSYWYVGLEASSPLVFDDFSSWNKEDKLRLGLGVQGKVGYMFSSVFGLEAGFMLGRARMQPSNYQNDWWLGKRDAYMYYPYTLIDGTVYTYPFVDPSTNTTLVGEQGNNLSNVSIEATPIPKLNSSTNFWQASIRGQINITRLFYTGNYEEKPVELFLAPGFYLSHFNTTVTNTTTGERAAVGVNRKLTWGLGSDLSLRFNLSRRLALDLTGRVIWERDHAMDGVLSAKKAYDNLMVQPAVGLVYKFRRPQGTAPVVEEPTPMPLLGRPGEPAQPWLDLQYWYPEEPLAATKKVRKHKASVYLTFVLDRTFLAPDLHDNPRELKKIQDEVQLLANNPDYSVQRIFVEGFASPEGPYDNNMRLGEGRARTITNYILSQSNRINRSMVEFGRMTENWEGLRDTLTLNPSLPSSKELLALMDREKDTEVVKVKMRKLKGFPWLLENVFPRLRKSTYEVEYAIRDYNVEDARRIIRTNPTALSPEEMYAVADSYGLGTPEATEALSILQQHYPESDIALLCAAIADVQAKAYDTAVAKLQRMQTLTPTAYNVLGVAYAYSGRLQEAQVAFAKASAQHKDARRNLNAILRIKGNNAQ